MRRYILQILIAFDQFLCTLVGGWADESLSSYAHRLERQGKFWGRLWRPVIDRFFHVCFGQQQHCYQSYLAERERAHLPPELR